MRAWIAGARPRTLGASVVPVLVGSAVAASPSPIRAALALITAVGLQVGVNYLNDYFDGTRGVDTAERAGPMRLTATGTAPAGHVRRAGIVALGIAASAGATLCLLADRRLLIVGAAFLVAAVLYSGGPRPYASIGLGEIIVFLTFGLGAVVGTAYVHDRTVRTEAWWSSVSVGLLAAAIMLVNNIRDVRTDRAAGKMTLAVRIGERRARALYRSLLAASVGVPLGAAWAGILPVRVVAIALTVPLVALASKDVRNQGRALVATLQKTALLHALHGVILAWAAWHA